ncbi:ead/Ea22-like family protein [Klebsiella quasipneumoniae]|uniref:ead/Ea22-like family protein n=1 Tax=Klebsiella quasipneumoniae TaxID=1463165 RepID=UPI00352A481C
MNDIELARSLKAAAENAIGAHERLAAYPYGEIIDISQHEGEQIDIDITDLNEFNKEANPVNIIALVEALESEKRICATWRKTAEANSEKLEKAQQRIGKLEKKLTDHKRMNQEMAKAMLTPNDSDAAGMEIAALRQRIAGLESRTVKLPLPSCTYADHSYPAYSKRQVISLLESLGITVVEGDV